MNTKTLIKTAFLAMLLFTFSCKKSVVSTTDTKETQFAREAIAEDGNSDEEPILGDKLDNPYLVDNMQKAADELAVNGIKSSCPLNIRTTHYYVMFKPKDMDEYEKIDNDERIGTSEDIPIDQQILVDGGNYHDPSLPDSVPTYQYCAVKADYPFDLEVQYEILARLYIPEEDEDLNCNEDNEEYIDKLLDQAYKQTGNFDDVLDSEGYKARRAKWYPKGRIELNDTRLNSNIGLQGIRVKARRWFTTRIMLTDFNGNYSTNKSFRRPCNYSLKFGRPNFCVRKHFIPGTYRVGGPKKTGDWNTVLASGYQRFAGHIFRGAQTYFYQNIGGLTNPYHGQRQVLIGYDDKMSNNKIGINWIVLPIIRVARYFPGEGTLRELGSDVVYSTTCHEIAHSTHCFKLMNFSPIQFWQTDAFVRESFCTGIEWFLTQREYQMRGIADYGTPTYSWSIRPAFLGYQNWTRGVSTDYTNIFINLIDDYNERVERGDSRLPDDNVSGYTMPFIEQNIMRHSYGLTTLRDEVKAHKPNGTVTDAQIDVLFNSY
jgi:hypothetical protein